METPSKSARPATGTGYLTRVTDSPIFRYLVLSGELAVVLWVIWSYSLEGRVFEKLAVLVWAGFTVNYFLPPRARLPFFGLLSAAGILVILGPSQGGWLLVLGLALIGICHLPIPFGGRLAILFAAAAGLGLMRAGRIPVPWSAAVWPILGSMFALRLMIYLYDLKHGNAPFSFWRSVAYFFMLPNVVFPLFPVVDYQTLSRSHEADEDRSRVFQTGIDWMTRGTVHLVLYRLIYQHLPIDTSGVVDLPQLARYLLWPFLLYLNVSGLFHLVIGMLYLFGFKLPETHHLFYLASSFTDFWRRINIYWKDFMMKVFYYPAFFRLRRRGNNLALILGTFVVFFATWVLHSWQWFWLRGSFLFKPADILFWTILAVLVAGNVLIEANRPMTRRLASGVAPLRESVRKGFQALAVFSCICLLWSLWVSDSVSDWLSLFSVVKTASAGDLWLLPAAAGLAAAFVLAVLYFERRKARPFRFYRHAVQTSATLVVLGLIGWPKAYNRLGENMAGVLGKLQAPGLNSRDAARRQRDYYEKLNDVGWENAELAKVYMVKPADWGAIRFRPDLVKLSDGLPYMELLPNAHGRHRGAQLQFNRWGMRDRDYTPEPEADTYRIALLGASHTFASGVAQGEAFETLVEDRLNREDRLGPFRRVEILNFAAEGYGALDVLALTDKKVFAFRPHAILYVVHQIDAQYAVARLSRILTPAALAPYPELLEFARSAGVPLETPEKTALAALEPRREALLGWAYQQLVERCRAHGAVPVMAYLPILTPQKDDLPVSALLAIGREAGFLTLDLSAAYEGQDPEKLEIAIWDDHPNVLAHRLVAERLYSGIRSLEDSLWRKNAGQADQRANTRLHPQGVPPGRGP